MSCLLSNFSSLLNETFIVLDANPLLLPNHWDDQRGEYKKHVCCHYANLEKNNSVAPLPGGPKRNIENDVLDSGIT